ncbi:alpha-ketoglutarate-dependent dioxygenase AlkB family protein [Alteromonas ponticola]|uniref:Alpha-ketoglutarate-dependent dioxygenase AlkB n=1 Tax=Alteromonas ponticola TaxID=2720613 RepID=A0ABX1R1P7_9ALTE|nr:alpha-ketoglutarate-dependent dioxygenase AlkB [Alteromonas ponticola]NMH60379.1 alpha-ketoglutarate-dependent dioxygenase AlkB [Alteromonas ponticola]
MKQQGLFEQSTVDGESLPLPDADVTYYANWLSQEMADELMQKLKGGINWQQESITLYGKRHRVPRLQAWHGDSECLYQYSGLTLEPKPWDTPLTFLKNRCESLIGSRFNSVLLNWYRNGQDSMGLHADDEPELGRQPVIASVTLGAERAFIFKHRTLSQRHTITLHHGSLLIMAGSTQQHYLHGINKTVKPVGDRINLTFRYIHPQD